MNRRDKFAATIAVLLILAGMFTVRANYGYRMLYKGETIGFVQDLKSVSRAVQTLEEEFVDLYGEEIILESQVGFRYEAEWVGIYPVKRN